MVLHLAGSLNLMTDYTNLSPRVEKSCTLVCLKGRVFFCWRDDNIQH